MRAWAGVAFAWCALAGPASSSAAPPPAGCRAPAFHAFDFWLGDWDAFDRGGGPPVARMRVTSLLGGCALRERYTSPEASGESLSVFDASHGVWRQLWTTDRGHALSLEGRQRGHDIVLTGSDRAPEGSVRLVRGTWEPLRDGLRERAERSRDGGKTWRTWFDLIMRPHRESHAARTAARRLAENAHVPIEC